MTAGAEPWSGNQASRPGPDLRAQHELSDRDGTQCHGSASVSGHSSHVTKLQNQDWDIHKQLHLYPCNCRDQRLQLSLGQ